MEYETDNIKKALPIKESDYHSETSPLSYELEHACLLIAGIGYATSFKEFKQWYNEQKAVPDSSMDSEDEWILRGVKNNFSFASATTRYSDATAFKSRLQDLIEKKIIPARKASIPLNPSAPDIRVGSYAIDRVDLQRFCLSIGIFPSFLLPFPSHIVSSRIVEQQATSEFNDSHKKSLLEEIQNLKNEISRITAYKDIDDPNYLPEVHACMEAFLHFYDNRKVVKRTTDPRGSAKITIRRWVKSKYRLNNAAAERISEINNWEKK